MPTSSPHGLLNFSPAFASVNRAPSSLATYTPSAPPLALVGQGGGLRHAYDSTMAVAPGATRDTPQMLDHLEGFALDADAQERFRIELGAIAYLRDGLHFLARGGGPKPPYFRAPLSGLMASTGTCSPRDP